MNKAVKALWIEALRSGKYEQTAGVLRDQRGFCCLGVLCDLYQKQHEGTTWIEGRRESTYDFLHCNTFLPAAVREWAELDNADPRLGDGHDFKASNLNDCAHASFAKIADLIEENL